MLRNLGTYQVLFNFQKNMETPTINEEYRPRFLQQTKLIQELTGTDEKDILETAKKNYMADWLLNYVSRFYNEDEKEILSPRKFRSLVMVRGIYSYYMKRKLSYSLPQIGRRVGNRDHTTILGVIRKIEEKKANDPGFEGELESLWLKAEGEFEEYVKKENKQLNLPPQNPTVISEFGVDNDLQQG